MRPSFFCLYNKKRGVSACCDVKEEKAVKLKNTEKTREALYEELLDLRKDVLKTGTALFEKWKPAIERKRFTYSAWNLAFYLALRCRDLRSIQKNLLPLGLSSLGRGEARAIDNLDAVMASLGRICNKQKKELIEYPSAKAFFFGDKLLAYNTSRVFGVAKELKQPHVMVTLPTEAAKDEAMVYSLIEAGMDCARINCAHDDRQSWARMIEFIHKAEKRLKKRCKIYMDLAGPKVRIDAVLSRGADVKIMSGDTIFLVSGAISQYPADYAGSIVISCSIPGIFSHLKAGQPVLIDDGKVRTKVEKIVPEGAYLQVPYAKPQGVRIKSQKSLNFPETEMEISPLTDKDLADLDFVAEEADAVGYSFVQSGSDIKRLQQELAARRGKKWRKIAIIAKIETQMAVEHLPEIIVQAASKQPLGIMIARGDLAVEVGYRRLAELQEEILWICEAAHVPVVWATQVLENMVKTGIPSRAEITDAAMSERAECVMLNKGPYVVEAVSVLRSILQRMGEHQHKKTAQLRALHIACRAVETMLDPDAEKSK